MGTKQEKGLYKRGGIWWCRTDPVEGVPRSTKSKTRAGAKEWLQERERRAANPSYAASHEETLKVWVGKMLADKEQLKSEATLRFYKQKSGHLLRIFGEECPLVRINSDAVDDYKNKRFAEGAHHYTISKEFNALRQTLKKAARASVYAHDLATLFPSEFGLGYSPRETVLSPEAEEVMRRELPPERWGAVAYILGTSARLGELMRAEPGDWDKAKGTVLIRGTKTEKSRRVIPVLSVTRAYLEAAQPYLPFQWPRMAKDLAEFCVKWKLPHVSPNDLRRTCATRLIEAGCEPYFVSRITGHSDLKMLKKVYDRSTVESVGERMERQLQAHLNKKGE